MVRHVDIAHKWLHSQWNDINLQYVLKLSCTREKKILTIIALNIQGNSNNRSYEFNILPT